MKIEIRKPVYFIPNACSVCELFIARNDFMDSYEHEQEYYYDEFKAMLEMYCAPHGFKPEMNKATAEEIYKTLSAGKKTLEGIYCGISLEAESKSLYIAYAAYGAPGKRINLVEEHIEDKE